MASTITFNGVTYSIPAVGDDSWGTDLSNYFIAIASGALQKTGGNFTLTSEVDFGASHGAKLAYLKSQAANPSGTGIVRLGNAEAIKWRNAANNADIELSVNASDQLVYNGGVVKSGLIVNVDVDAAAAIAYSKLNLASSIVNNDISGSAAIAYSKLNLATSIVNADISGSAAIAYSKLNLALGIVNGDISASAAIDYSKLAALTASRALVSDGSGFVSASSVTATELGLLSGVTGTLATIAGTQVLTNKDIDGGTASNTSRITLPKAAKTTLDGLTRKQGTILYDTTSNKPYYDDGTNLQLIGSGSGGSINFISNPDAETGTTGWTVDSFAAATRPSGALTGVSTGVTFTSSSTAPLAGTNSFLLAKDAANRQGRVVYTGITLTPAYFAKVLNVTADYIVSSGTFVAGSTTADSDVIFYLQNVTDGTFIEPSSFKLLSNSSTISDRFSGTFQTGASATSYRLLIYIASTSASAYTLKLDNISVSPSNYVYGTPITDWVSYTPTGSWTTNTTYTGKWRRVGDSAEYQIDVTTSGAPTATTLRVNLPSGHVIDTTKRNASTGGVGDLIGTASILDSGTFEYTVGSVQYFNTTSLEIRWDNPANSAAQPVTETSPMTWASGDKAYIRVTGVPISGWSSSTQVSDSFDSRAIVLTRFNQTTQSINNNVLSIVDFPVASIDTTASWRASSGAFNSASGTFATTNPGFVVPSSGQYRVSAGVRFQGTVSPAANSNLLMSVYLDGVLAVDALGSWQNGGSAGTNIGPGASGSATINARAGQVIDIRITHSFGAASVLDNNSRTYLSIEKLQAPTTISATEVVAFSAEGATSNSVGTNTVVSYNTVTDDTHNGYNTSTDVYTIPISGKYEVYAQHRISTSTTATVNQFAGLLIQVDSSTKQEHYKYVENTGVGNWFVTGSYQANLNAGQTIRIIADTNITTPQLSTSATQTRVQIKRIK